MNTTIPWVAVVDDDDPVRQAIVRLLDLAGIGTRGFAGGAEFLDFLSVSKPACVVLDVHMPDMSGFEVQTRLTQDSPHTQIIFITGNDSLDTHRCAMLARPIAYLKKPMSAKFLIDAIKLALIEVTRQDVSLAHRQTPT